MRAAGPPSASLSWPRIHEHAGFDSRAAFDRGAEAQQASNPEERTYPTPWTRCDREDDYGVAWEAFEKLPTER